MNSRCLYCDKRLSLFHGKKKPFCSDDHEDLYLQRQALSGLERLRDNNLKAPSPLRALAPATLPPAETTGQFAYPELEPGFFDDEPAAGNLAADNGPPADVSPPLGDFLIWGSDEVQACLPSIPFRDPGQAAFCALAWSRPVLLQGAPLFLAPAQIGPTPVSLAVALQNPEPLPPPLATSLERLPMPLLILASLAAHLDSSKISPLPGPNSAEPPLGFMPRLETRPQAIEPQSPPTLPLPQLIASLDFPSRPLQMASPQAQRTFLDCSLEMAFPLPVSLPPCNALRFVEAPPAQELSSQPGQPACLPAPEPLRFRTLLDLRVSVFQTSTRCLFPAPRAPLSWNAEPPEALDWPLALLRRRPGPILPKLEPVLSAQ